MTLLEQVDYKDRGETPPDDQSATRSILTDSVSLGFMATFRTPGQEGPWNADPSAPAVGASFGRGSVRSRLSCRKANYPPETLLIWTSSPPQQLLICGEHLGAGAGTSTSFPPEAFSQGEALPLLASGPPEQRICVCVCVWSYLPIVRAAYEEQSE